MSRKKSVHFHQEVLDREDEFDADDFFNQAHSRDYQSRMTYGTTDAMIDVTKRASTRAVTEEEQQAAIMGPLFKMKKEKEARAKLKAEQAEAKRVEQEKIQGAQKEVEEAEEAKRRAEEKAIQEQREAQEAQDKAIKE